MALPPLVYVDALEAWMGRAFTGDDLARAEAVLSAVSALVRSETGLTWSADGISLDDLVPAEVTAVTLQVAQRVFTNPNGVRQESIGSYSVSYAEPTTTGLFLTAQERAMLGRHRTNARGLWSLSTTRADDRADTTWVPVQGAEYPFPWYGGD